jgi:hypothetical protein
MEMWKAKNRLEMWKAKNTRLYCPKFIHVWFSTAKMHQYFRTRSPVMVDIDDWHAPRDHIAPLFFNNNTNLHCLIRECLIFPYLTGSFHPEFLEEYFLWLSRNPMVTFASSCAERSSVDAHAWKPPCLVIHAHA